MACTCMCGGNLYNIMLRQAEFINAAKEALSGKAEPHQIVLTTFTEKVAFEIRDRLYQYAALCGYVGPIYEMRIVTIHSICDTIIRQYVEYIPSLKKNYIVLDDLLQHFFINENFDPIIKQEIENDNLPYRVA